jgi:adenylate cyclase
MTQDGFTHKLAAILSADVAGYSRLIAEDEVSAVRNLNAYRGEMATIVGHYPGRVVDFVGDNMLAEFSSAIDAVNCAIHIHRALKGHNDKLAPERRMDFRIGIHLGDIMVDGGNRIYGDGINIAARLETLAEPGGICISDLVYRQIRGKIKCQFVDVGEQNLKNIPDPVHVYRIVDTGAAPQHIAAAAKIVKRPTLRLPVKPSLTVLPFVNLNPEIASDHISDGLTLDIIAGLVQIPELMLISWVSIGNHNDVPISVQEIGRILGVNHVLDGGIRRFDDQLRITARLTETQAGRQLWAKRFDCKLDELFTVQDKIIEEIITALDVELVTGQVARILRQGFQNPGAIESYYRGWGALFRSSHADIYLARQMSEETIRLEPDSPLGYSLAAFSHLWAVSQNAADDVASALDKAAELALHAIQLKDATGLPDLVMAHIHLLKREHDEALAASERSVMVRPNCHASHVVKANILNYISRFDEATDLANYAIRLYPVYPAFYSTILANAYYGSNRHEEAIASAAVSLSIDPDSLDALIVMVGANAALNRMEEARGAAQEILKIKPGFSLKAYFNSQPYKNTQNVIKLVTVLNNAGLPE